MFNRIHGSYVFLVVQTFLEGNDSMAASVPFDKHQLKSASMLTAKCEAATSGPLVNLNKRLTVEVLLGVTETTWLRTEEDTVGQWDGAAGPRQPG